eukprot:TRINITY_DN12881_c0_g2_i1.p1 TRINITY_DN12881_c0_g2~~TRINITY_DN12881_c0_g2_i1.p1  ORF type:complete len:907 (+),score=95.92 TRINITY_DN12881_c0_g2_i1:186-2906(+)
MRDCSASQKDDKTAMGPPRSRKPTKFYVVGSRYLIEHKFVVALTTVLTIWALTGDDLRFLFTSKPVDIYYDYVVLFCLFVFSTELVLSCFGKDDYFLGFFFWLDFVSTLTLLLDLTFIQAALFGNGEDGGLLRGGRTAKLSARGGRVVRVIRLVRILKLYKAYHEAKMRKKAKEDRLKRAAAGEDEWDELDLEDGEDAVKGGENESRVGKKLTDLTIRKVICVILAMLFFNSLISEGSETGTSAEFGADYILSMFHKRESGAISNVLYEKSVIEFAYYHNWYAGVLSFCRDRDILCPNQYYGRLFWIGMTGSNATSVLRESARAKLSKSTVTAFNENASKRADMYNFGIMPMNAQTSLASPWTRNCDMKTTLLRGISLIDSELGGNIGCPVELRSGERLRTSPRSLTVQRDEEWNFVFYFDIRAQVRGTAVFSLLTTVFIMIMLVAGSMMFSSDANRLVVHPVEKMIRRVELIRDDPLVAMKMADEEFKAEEVAKALQARQERNGREHLAGLLKKCRSDTKSESMETVVLEKTIIKLGSLLALGFGEAGANIIGQNMKGADTSGVNVMIPGAYLDCIVGVATVRDFSTATEVLQTRIMTFVNQIAEIVHGVVNDFHGSPNRNNGDHFLIIWRFTAVQPGEAPLDQRSRKADMSLVAFSMILGALHSSSLLATYRQHPGLQMRLGNGYRVNLSFGLHLGWAIEGAVGSEYKIDASYLSPNVSLAFTVERVTQTYGVSLMASHSLVEACTPSVAIKCRLLDRVILSGSAFPINLYCLDLDYLSVSVAEEKPLMINWVSRTRFRARQFIEAQKNSKWSDDFNVAALFEQDFTLACMRRRYTIEFFQLFNMGFQNYSQGEWQVARRMLSCTRAILGIEDGPSNALLRYMEDPNRFEAPRGWRGVREMDPK